MNLFIGLTQNLLQRLSLRRKEAISNPDFSLKCVSPGLFSGLMTAHWCQLNVKPLSSKELKFLANNQSHLEMTKHWKN